MRFFIYLFVSLSLLVSQEELIIVKTDYQSKIQTIEQDILNNVLALYKKRAGKNLKLRFIGSKDFSKLFSMVDSLASSNKDNTLLLTAVTITKERLRKYDFSVPYMPAKDVIFGKKDKWENGEWVFGAMRIGYTNKSVQEKIAKAYKVKYGVQIKAFHSWEHMVEGLHKNEIDAGLMDNVSVWADDRLMVIKDVEKEYQQGNGFGILYPKGSALKAKLDPIIRYYIKSQKFYAFCAKQYGREVADYYKEHVLLERKLK
jgi:polar amino acid transport system substrate-binding protein